jgi:hypothetical protein
MIALFQTRDFPAGISALGATSNAASSFATSNAR